MEYDVEKVMIQNEEKSGIIVRQRQELESQERTIRALKAENAAMRHSMGVLRFRLWERATGASNDIPKGEIVARHGWTDEHSTYRMIVVRMPKEATP